jgi:hypothetical protein
MLIGDTQYFINDEELYKVVNKLKQENEEFKNSLKDAKEMLNIQGQKGNYDYDEYMLGLYNGMENIISLFEKREPKYIDGKSIKLSNSKKNKIDKAYEVLDNYQNNLYSKKAREYLDDDIEYAIQILKGGDE